MSSSRGLSPFSSRWGREESTSPSPSRGVALCYLCPDWTGHKGMIFCVMSQSSISCAELRKSIVTVSRPDGALYCRGWTGFRVDVSPCAPSLCVPMLDGAWSLSALGRAWDCGMGPGGGIRPLVDMETFAQYFWGCTSVHLFWP